ncbi:hypothetical protein PV08_02873 [Exophiala spinifera]|uniref:Transcription factor domain-containing protein n=1 Tax=Exophiala spinifera TaxID=91928 RepID=A0A0D2BJ38_9EURO|nr:uncharacterized protein PV08_02873 [Exophiala spinifera]KIW18585.1 hypothetical protein PV08_02873 [Exophiala spinifera]
MATSTILVHYPSEEETLLQLDSQPMSGEKRSSEQPAPFRGEFSFVNKDAGNIDSKDHNAAVSWHVMNRYERWKKQDQARRLRASANVPVGPLSTPSQPQQSQQSSQPQQRQQPPSLRSPAPGPAIRRTSSQASRKARLTEQTQTPSTFSANPFSFNPWMAEQPLQLGYPGIIPAQGSAIDPQRSSASTPSAHSVVTDEDPSSMFTSMSTPLDLSETLFDTSGLSLNPLVSGLISYAYDMFIPQLWPQESTKSLVTYEVSKCWDDTTMISQDTCYANAYLSVLAAAMAIMTDDESLAYQSRYFQGQAMVELRQRASQPNPPELSTLKAILKLFASETLVDNTAVARMHLKMLRNLVNAAGGVLLMDSWFREDLLSSDCYFALKYETRPLFPAQEWTPGPLSQPWKARLLSAGILGEHAAGVDPLIEHPILKGVVTDLRELFKTREYLHLHEVPTDDQLLRWQQLRKFDCIARLADHHVNLSIYPHLFQQPITQAYSCIATALMASMVLGSPEPVRFGLRLITNLRAKITESESEGDNTYYSRLRLWALYVGSLAEKVHPVGTEHDLWFTKAYTAQMAEMRLQGFDDVKKVIRHFLYSERLHQEVESGRPHRLVDAKQGLYSVCGTSWREPILQPELITGSFEQEDAAGMSAGAGKKRADD